MVQHMFAVMLKHCYYVVLMNKNKHINDYSNYYEVAELLSAMITEQINHIFPRVLDVHHSISYVRCAIKENKQVKIKT